MGQEIERARALLGALTRERVLTATAASSSYEEWVATADPAPFSRYLINKGADAEQVRQLLRLQAVQGLPDPELYTYERFEDLLIGQLGIEAGMLSPKILRTTREVQDKKAKQGKLRRLADLLPRAGFDPKLLGLLEGHLRERVILCRGCLGRYPRKDMGHVEVDCPRCGYSVAAESLQASSIDLLPEAQRHRLLASSECIMETINVADRQRTRAERGSGESSSVIAGLASLLIVVLVVLGILITQREKEATKVAPRKKRTASAAPTPTPTPTPTGLSLGEIKARAPKLLAAGEYDELLALWRAAAPPSGRDADAFAKERRLAIVGLERLKSLSGRVAPALQAARNAPSDASAEGNLARLLRDAPDAPPFQAAVKLLRERREARRAKARALGQTRLTSVKAADSNDAWSIRTKRIRRAGALLKVPIAGRMVDGVRVKALDHEGMTLLTPQGEKRFIWGEHPRLALRILIEATDPKAKADQRVLLRAAILAGHPRIARQAARRLKLSREDLRTQELLSSAPASAPPVPTSGQAAALRFPTAWVPFDLTPRGSTSLSAEPGPRPTSDRGVLVLGGSPCELIGPFVPAQASTRRGRRRVSVAIELAAEAQDPFIGLRLQTKTSEWTYIARWNDEGWRLELDLGRGGTNLLASAKKAISARKARLSFDGRELVFELDDIWVTAKAASAGSRFENVGLRVGAKAGPLKLKQLEVAGAIQTAWYTKALTAWTETVNDALDGITSDADGGSRKKADTFRPVDAEDMQALALVQGDARQELERAKTDLLAGKAEAAIEELTRISDPVTFPAASYYHAYASLLRDDAGTAIRLLSAVLERWPGFVEARALLGLAYAIAHQPNQVEPLIDDVMAQRPDLALAHLARARMELLRSDPTIAPPRGWLRNELALIERLGGGEPLIEQQARALKTTLRLLEVSETRLASERHAILTLSDGPAINKSAAMLDKLAKTFERSLGKGPAGLVTTVLLPPAEYRAAGGGDEPALYRPALGLLIVAGAPQKPSRKLALAVAAAHVAHRYGAAPGWLDVGLIEYLTTEATREHPQGYARLLKDGSRYQSAEWRRLFAESRTTCLNNRQARARSWLLVTMFTPRKQQLRPLLDLVERGRPLPIPPTGIKLRKLEDAFRRFLVRFE